MVSVYQPSVDLLDSTGGSELDNHRTDIIDKVETNVCNYCQA